MLERFTERARQVVVLAHEEAGTLKHGHIGPEHLLLGLLREQDGIAARVLASFDVTVERVRGEVVRIVGVGEQTHAGQVPLTPQGKRVLELALQEAVNLGHNYIGTEHLLLGLLALGDGVSKRILLDCAVDPDRLRQAVIRAVSSSDTSPESKRPETAPPESDNGFEEWIRVGPGAGLRRMLMVAAARALEEGREEIQPRDVLLALTRDEHTGPLLAELGVDDVAIRRAIGRRAPRAQP